jgi:hypothetical protein
MMRKVIVSGFVLVAAAVMFTAAQGYTPILLEPPIKTASEVVVTNFPAVQQVGGAVNVGNLPAVQNVGGTVNIGNLPAFQTVGGTVNVGNLPLDPDGNLRVGGGPAHPAFLFTKIIDGANLTGGSVVQLPLLSVGGWKNATILLRTTGVTAPGPGIGSDCPTILVDNSGGGIPVNSNSVNACYQNAGQLAQQHTEMALFAPDLKVTLVATSDAAMVATVDVWLYLTD